MFKLIREWLTPRPKEEWEEFFKIECVDLGVNYSISLYYVVDRDYGQTISFPNWGKSFNSYSEAVSAIKNDPSLMMNKLADRYLASRE